jgi:hypothetical protein
VPPWVLDNIRDQLVLPRVQHEVEEWNPMTDTVPIHAWIHPWLPLLGMYFASHLSSACSVVREKSVACVTFYFHCLSLIFVKIVAEM